MPAKRLEKGDPEMIVNSTNTIHKMADDVKNNINLPLIPSADTTVQTIKGLKLNKIGLLGTKFTMKQDFNKGRLTEKHGLRVVIPNIKDREKVQKIINNELYHRNIKDSSEKEHIRIIENMIENRAEEVILGCIKIPFRIKQGDVKFPIFDTTTIYYESAALEAIKLITHKNQTNNEDTKEYALSYFSLRIAVGILGLSLPFILVIGSIILDGENKILYSISAYYHTRIRNGLIGIMSAVSIFLFAYKGHDSRDNIAGHLGGIFALGAAFFPNSQVYPITLIHKLHITSATLFFLVLIYFSTVLFTASDKPKPYPKAKKNRNRVYYICGFTMIVCIILIALLKFWLEKSFPQIQNLNLAFWLETIALIASGISWITKGQTFFKDAVAN